MDHRLDFLRQVRSEPGPAKVTFKHRHPTQSEVALHYYPRKDGQDRPPAHLLLFVLGNPGLLGYYTPFLTYLQSLLPSSFGILSTSHIGHTPDLATPVEPLDLEQQLEAKIELITMLIGYLDGAVDFSDQTTAAPKISLIGHSVGAWFSCEIMKRLGKGIHAGYMLFPTLGWIADTWNGRTLWPIFRFPVKPLLPILSPFLRPVLLLTTFPPTTLQLLRSSKVIRHVLGLSRSEMDEIRDPDLEWFRSQAKVNGRGVYTLYSAGNLDGWVGREGPMVREALGGEAGGRVKMLDGIPHAFCLSEEHGRAVADVLAAWIAPGSQETPFETGPTTDEVPTVATMAPM